MTHRSADHTGTHTPGRGRADYAHTVNYPPRRHPPRPPPGDQHPTPPRALTRGETDAQCPWVKLPKTQSIHTHELYTKPRGAHIRTRRSTLLYPKFHAEKPRTPAARRTARPPARSSHPLLLPLTTNAAGPGQAGPGRAAPVARRPGGRGRPGSSRTGVRPGPLAACPSAGPRGQASSVSPALGAWGPRPPAGSRRSRSAGVPAPGLPPWLRARETRAPAARGPGQGHVLPGRPPASPHRRPSAGVSAAAQPGRARARPPPPRPPRLPPPPRPGPARNRRRGARTCSRRAGLYGGGRRGLRGGRGRGGGRGAPSAADRAPPAAGEGARRVSAGRDGEAGSRLGVGPAGDRAAAPPRPRRAYMFRSLPGSGN